VSIAKRNPAPSATAAGALATVARLLRLPRRGTPSSGRSLVSLCAAVAVAAAAALAPASASAYDLTEFDVTFADPGGETENQAGAHPDAVNVTIGFPSTPTGEGGEVTEEPVKDLIQRQVKGLVGNPYATPRCATVDFLTRGEALEGEPIPACPDVTALGYTSVKLGGPKYVDSLYSPVYNLAPPPGAAAKIGWWAEKVPITVEFTVAETPPYNIVAASTNISQIVEVIGATVTLWGVPADASHDPLRGPCLTAVGGESAGECPAKISPRPFLTLPRACEGPLATHYRTDTWVDPGAFGEGFAETHNSLGEPEGFKRCDRLGFEPETSARPSSAAASSPSGLDFSLDTANEGLENPDGISNADVEKAVVTLPKGMTINPSQAEGLETCSEAQFKAESPYLAPGEGPTYVPPSQRCPEASKVGTVEVETPILENHVLHGSVYVATPYENRFGALIALYMVVRDPQLGVVVKMPLKVEPDPVTGQLVTVSDEIPPFPFSHFKLHLREGGRSPLITPPGCGTFQTKAMLYPSSGGAPFTSNSSFQIVSGPDGGPCPSGAAGFSPGFEAGTRNNAAGSYSPFDMRIARGDGEQDMGKFSFVLPPGVVPKLAGVPYCSDAAIAQARGRTGEHGGQEEKDSPSCPAASQIGTTLAGAGAGSQLTYVGGKLYLAGPYHGDPISAVAIVPAVAGPFDAGTVVVREALRLNPVTHVGEVDGSASDPIPHILKGIPLNVREVRVSAERPGGFTLNPTSCEPFQARSTIWGDGTALAPLAPHPVDLSTRFQAAGCASLGFKPRLNVKLRGGTKRGKFPSLRAVYTPRKHNQANLSRLALTFPNSEFIEQGHFRTICTRVQFAAGGGFGERCPKGSVYGHIKVWTPLLDEPLKGPVYLRSSNHNLPDAVFALHGIVDIELATRIDSVHGRLRAIVSGAPDAPVSRAIVNMQGGQKGLFVNSRYLCRKQKRNRARVNAGAQNGRRDVTRPVMRAVACGKHRRKAHKRHARRARVARGSAAR